MGTDFHPIHPDITADMWERLDAIIVRNRGVRGSVIGVLRECQDVVGYLPVELIDYISTGLNLSRSEVFGVASFYALFSLHPKGRGAVSGRLRTGARHGGQQGYLWRCEIGQGRPPPRQIRIASQQGSPA